MPNRRREGADDPHAAALRASEQRYRDLIAILPDALFIQHGGFVTFANVSAAKLFGATSPSELIGRSVMSLFDARHHPAIRKRIELLNAGMSVPFIEEHIVRLDGSLREVEVAATPYEGEPTAGPTLPPSTATHLFRIAQEATTNAARHAKAHHVQIRLQQLSELLRLDIIDDGAAQHRARFEPSTGIGLKTMEYRARLIGGRLTVQRQQGNGTRVRFEMPQFAVS